MGARVKVLLIALVSASIGLVGCTTVSIPQHQPTLDTVLLLRDPGVSALNVGEFSAAKGLAPAADRFVSVRGSKVLPSNGTSFAMHLQQSLSADLQAAGKLDAAAPRVIRGELTENRLDAAGISEASSSLAATFRVVQGERLLYEKLLRVDHSWKSGFVGALAIPAAINQYTEQFARLLAQLYQDADFKTAVAP